MADITKEEVLALAEEFETRLKNVSAGRGFGPGTHPDAVRRTEIFATALRAYAEAMSAVPVAWRLVPESALAWLFGEGPAPDGTEFGEGPRSLGMFWWRTEFRKMLASAPPPTAREIGEGR